MNYIQDILIDYIKTISTEGNDFIETFKMVFTIKEICKILDINRNRYYYLLRTGKLDEDIRKLKVKIDNYEK